MIMWTDDPERDDMRYQADLERQARKYPVCMECGERIIDEYVYVDDSGPYHEECLLDKYRESMTRYMGGMA